MTYRKQQNLGIVCPNERVFLQQASKKSRYLVEKFHKLVCKPSLVQFQWLIQLVNTEHRGVVKPFSDRCLHCARDGFQLQRNLSENQIYN